MRRITRQALRSVMVAVVFAASSLNGYLASAEAFAHEGGVPSATQEHVDSSDHVQSAADQGALASGVDAAHTAEDGIDGHGPHGAGPCNDMHCCPHMHAHCCASAAVTAGDCGLKLALDRAQLAPERDAPLSLGQQFYPLLRPPSATA